MPHRSESERIAALDAALEALCGAFGPSGHEFQGVAGRIAEMVRPLADELALRCPRQPHLHPPRRARGEAHHALHPHGPVRAHGHGDYGRRLPARRPAGRAQALPALLPAGGVRQRSARIISHESAVKENEAELKHLYVDIGARNGKEAGELVLRGRRLRLRALRRQAARRAVQRSRSGRPRGLRRAHRGPARA